MGRRASANVLIFPHCVWPPRTWPKSYFIELGYKLQQRGLTVKMVTEERDYELLIFPRHLQKELALHCCGHPMGRFGYRQ